MTPPPSKNLFVLGGARSGKSRYAQARAEAFTGACIFIATAQAFDVEMSDRIAQHRADRGTRWSTVEAPVDVAGAIAAHDAHDTVLLIDCLTLWASNLMFEERDIRSETERLVAVIRTVRSPLIFVANEVGLGIVPDNVLARRFRDIAGSINQAVAAASDEAVMMFAGLPMWLKNSR